MIHEVERQIKETNTINELANDYLVYLKDNEFNLFVNRINSNKIIIRIQKEKSILDPVNLFKLTDINDYLIPFKVILEEKYEVGKIFYVGDNFRVNYLQDMDSDYSIYRLNIEILNY